jgi:hypothetical protein
LREQRSVALLAACRSGRAADVERDATLLRIAAIGCNGLGNASLFFRQERAGRVGADERALG